MNFTGRVVSGKQIGRTIGFPTANICADSPVCACDGVYAAWIYLPDGKHGCMINIGRHPTLPEGPRTIEAHIFDYSGDLYGQKLRVELVSFLRSERRFDGLDALIAQLQRDRKHALQLLNAQI